MASHTVRIACSASASVGKSRFQDAACLGCIGCMSQTSRQVVDECFSVLGVLFKMECHGANELRDAIPDPGYRGLHLGEMTC